jgi:hypothetical protein
MNSWMSMLLSACAPPLTMFIIGTGMTFGPAPPRYRYNPTRRARAAACAAASEMASSAFAPSRDFVSVASSAIIAASMPFWSMTSCPISALRNSPFALMTACSTPLPP